MMCHVSSLHIDSLKTVYIRFTYIVLNILNRAWASLYVSIYLSEYVVLWSRVEMRKIDAFFFQHKIGFESEGCRRIGTQCEPSRLVYVEEEK